jgi:hypothetical protein
LKIQTKVLNVRQFWVGGILLSTALSSSAITLGQQSGAGVLGRPLDIRVQAILAPSEEATDVCLSADVLYGETKLSPGAVRATLQRATPDAQASVRVRTSVAIDEPVVTVLVRAGCTAPFTRRYVLLADPITEPAATTATAAAGGVPAAPRALSAGLLPAVSALGGNALPNASARTTNGGSAVLDAVEFPPTAAQRLARASAKPSAAAPASRVSSVVRKPVAALSAPPSTPRLQLDAIDLSLAIERDPVLKLSLSLLSEPASSDDVRAAAGLLWKAINASPEDILRDNARLQALSAEVSALRDAQTSSQAAVSELTSRLEASRQSQWLVVGLGALLVLTLVALSWLWRRLKTRPDFTDNKVWWAQAKALNSGVHKSTQPRSAAESSSLLNRDRTPVPNTSSLKLRPLSPLADFNDSRSLNFEDSTPVPLAAAQTDFAPSQSASRSVATGELFDIQQRADFFISLGEDEQAINLLRDHIAESQVPSALTYLDLLKIYHRQGRQEEYEQVRTDFNRLFNAGAPAFEQFSDEGRGLEFYERALGRIQALWPEPRVLDVIEQSIFREAGDPQSEVFDLEAYRELLLLYALAKEVIQREAVDSKFPTDFENTKVQALKATARRGAAALTNSPLSGNPLPVSQRPPVSPNLGLDVNLDDLSASSTFEVALPDIDLSTQPTADAVRREESCSKNSNMIDFEVLDFTPPDEGTLLAELIDKKP